MPKKPIIIGVTGGSGGGKTSVSRAILSNFPDEKIAMIEHDSYYKDQSHLTFEELDIHQITQAFILKYQNPLNNEDIPLPSIQIL